MFMLLPGINHGMLFVYDAIENKVTFEDFSYLVRKTSLRDDSIVKIGFTKTQSVHAPKKDHTAKKFTDLEILSQEYQQIGRRSYLVKMVGLIPSLGPDYFKESIVAMRELISESRKGYHHYFDLLEKTISKDSKVNKKALYILLFDQEGFLKKVNNGRYRARITIDLVQFYQTGRAIPVVDYLKVTGNQAYVIATRELTDVSPKPSVSISEDQLIYITGEKQNPLDLGDLIFRELLLEGERRLVKFKQAEAIINKFFDYDFLVNFPYNFDSLGLE